MESRIYRLSNDKTHNNKDYVCMDKDAEPVDSDTSDKEGALFYGVRTTCGSLRCPPYKNHTEMLCVVCTPKCVIYTRIKA